MDESFFLRARRLLDQRQPAPIDHHAVVGAVRARQAGSPTALAAARSREDAAGEDDPHAICTLIRGEEDWRRAVQVQRGCFNRAAAARAVNIP